MQTLLDILGNIGFDWKVALANLANFLIIFWLLNKFIFGRVRDILKKRKEDIRSSIEESQKAKTAILMAEEEKKGILAEAKMEAGVIAENAYKKAKQTVEMAIKDAEKEARAVVKDAEKIIEKKKLESEKELKKKTSDLVIAGLEKVLSSEISAVQHEKIIKKITS